MMSASAGTSGQILSFVCFVIISNLGDFTLLLDIRLLWTVKIWMTFFVEGLESPAQFACWSSVSRPSCPASTSSVCHVFRKAFSRTDITARNAGQNCQTTSRQLFPAASSELKRVIQNPSNVLFCQNFTDGNKLQNNCSEKCWSNLNQYYLPHYLYQGFLTSFKVLNLCICN